MIRVFLVAVTLLLQTSSLFADTLDCSTRTNITAGSTAAAADVKTCMDNIVTFSSNISDNNIKTGAAIDAAKISGTALTLTGTQTVTGTKTFSGNVTVGDAVTDNLTVASAIQGTSALILDGSTDDTNETTISVTDPTADRTITIPDASVNLTSIGDNGDILQVVNTQTGAVATGTTVMPHDDTIPQSSEGDEYMTLAITPGATTNNLKIDVVFHGAISINGHLSVGLFQDSTAGALAAFSHGDTVAGTVRPIVFTHWMNAGTTSATTFKVRAGPDSAGTTTFNGTAGGRIFGGVAASSITITEIRDST